MDMKELMPESSKKDRVTLQAEEYRTLLVGYAYGLMQDHALAQDVVQDALMVVMNKSEEFREDAPILPWCRGIVRRKALQALTKRKRLVLLEDRALNDAVDDVFRREYDDGIVSEEYVAMTDALAHCTQRLPDAARALIMACYSEQLSYQELSVRFKIQIETVRKRLYRLRERLRHCIQLQRQIKEETT